MERRPEPELMDDIEQATAYASADFEGPNRLFVEIFERRFPSFDGAYMLDLGCGPGDITLRLARRYPGAAVHGVDGAPTMLALAREATEPALADRVRFIDAVLPLAGQLPEETYQAVVSNSLLHHLHQPRVLWQAVRQYGAPGAAVCIMDLFRPDSEDAARAIVEHYSGREPDVLKRDFYNSLLAAFTPHEVRAQLLEAGLEQLSVDCVSDRHLLIAGRL